MRRAIQQGRRIGIAPGFLPRFVDKVIEIMGARLPRAAARARRRSCVGTLGGGGLRPHARAGHEAARRVHRALARRRHDRRRGRLPAARHVRLPARAHARDRGRAGLDGRRRRGSTLLMDAPARAVARRAPAAPRSAMAGASGRASCRAWPACRPTSRATRRWSSTRPWGRSPSEGDELLVKLAESPFYATGGGQVADAGTIACESGDCIARVVDVVRVGDDQAVVVELERGELHPGERVVARVDRAARTATAANHTATHLLHAALRERLGNHVRQAGSYVGPDKLRFDFNHGERIAPEDLQAIEDRVNEWVLRNDSVRPITTTLDEARALGAMALFGEKYGDIVRMVQIGDGAYSRELCGGTHVRSTAEIGVFKLLGEILERGQRPSDRGDHRTRRGRRAACAHDAKARAAAMLLRTGVAGLPEAVSALQRACQAGRQAARPTAARRPSMSSRWPRPRARSPEPTSSSRWSSRRRREGAHGRRRPRQGQARRAVGDRARRRSSTVACTSSRRSRPRSWRVASRRARSSRRPPPVAGGGGGGRDTMAQAGGRDPDKLPDAIAAARAAIEAALGVVGRVLALDYGSARCGCAVSDPTGTLATPIDPVAAAGDAPGAGPHRRPRPRAGGTARRRRSAAVAVRRRLRPDGRDARVRDAAGAAPRRAGRALRRALHDADGAAAIRHPPRPRTPARRRICSKAGSQRVETGRAARFYGEEKGSMSRQRQDEHGRGRERTAEERERARLEREARRTKRPPPPAAPAPSARAPAARPVQPPAPKPSPDPDPGAAQTPKAPDRPPAPAGRQTRPRPASAPRAPERSRGRAAASSSGASHKRSLRRVQPNPAGAARRARRRARRRDRAADRHPPCTPCGTAGRDAAG